MKNQNKKLLALGLSVTMMFGACVPVAMAADPEPVETGSTTGQGTFEGHVEKSSLKVVLPTTSDSNGVFKFTADPELLIDATNNAKDSEATYTGTTGVYFQTDTSTYGPESKSLKVTNKGSVNATVTLAASVPADLGGITMGANGGSDITTANSSGTPTLYLGLKAPKEDRSGDTDEKAVTSTADDSKYVLTLAGKDSNFEVQYNSTTQKYEYKEKAGVLATNWNSFEFSMTGAAGGKWRNNDDTADLAAPTVTVTWSYAKADSSAQALPENAVNEAGPSISQTTLTAAAGDSVTITCDFGDGSLQASSITSVLLNNGFNMELISVSSMCTVSNNVITLGPSFTNTCKGQNISAAVVTISFDKGSPVDVTINVS